jgi:hypothetical protein
MIYYLIIILTRRSCGRAWWAAPAGSMRAGSRRTMQPSSHRLRLQLQMVQSTNMMILYAQ